MANSKTGKVIHHLHRVVLRDVVEMTDGELLDCFLTHRDDAAFAALVRRHGPMVWGVCRRLLHHHHDAEDAFQATFLVLVRKASSVEPREMVGNWLYGVAYQTARKARSMAARRKGRERQVVELPEPAVEEHDVWQDLQPLLDQELSRLPDKYRAPLVLCDLEGKTRMEAAQQLGWPEGTVAGRLATARRMLARRLARHGPALSGGALAAVLTENLATAGVPAAVVSSTIKAASLFAAGTGAAAGTISVQVAALTEGVLKAMLFTKLKVGMMLLVVAALIGAAGVIYQTRAAEPGPGPAGSEKLQNQLNKAGPTVAVARPEEDDQKGAAGARRLQAEVERLRAEIEELKKRLEQQGRKEKADEGKLVTKVYPVASLIAEGTPEGAQPLMRVLAKSIEPISWSENGGEGSMEYFPQGGSLVIRQSSDVHKQVHELLDALRKTKKEQKSGEPEAVGK
jgi:RNA polymerase sigma factor (sigma-70 family)